MNSPVFIGSLGTLSGGLAGEYLVGDSLSGGLAGEYVEGDSLSGGLAGDYSLGDSILAGTSVSDGDSLLGDDEIGRLNGLLFLVGYSTGSDYGWDFILGFFGVTTF